jgi:hypothetical protein
MNKLHPDVPTYDTYSTALSSEYLFGTNLAVYTIKVVYYRYGCTMVFIPYYVHQRVARAVVPEVVSLPRLTPILIHQLRAIVPPTIRIFSFTPANAQPHRVYRCTQNVGH